MEMSNFLDSCNDIDSSDPHSTNFQSEFQVSKDDGNVLPYLGSSNFDSINVEPNYMDNCEEFMFDEENSQFSSDLDDVDCEDEKKYVYNQNKVDDHSVIEYDAERMDFLKSRFSSMECDDLGEIKLKTSSTQASQSSEANHLSINNSLKKLSSGITCETIPDHRDIVSYQNNSVMKSLPKLPSVNMSSFSILPVNENFGGGNEKSFKSEDQGWKEKDKSSSLESELLRRGLEIKPIYMTANNSTRVNILPSNTRKNNESASSEGENTKKMFTVLEPGSRVNNDAAHTQKFSPNVIKSTERKTPLNSSNPLKCFVQPKGSARMNFEKTFEESKFKSNESSINHQVRSPHPNKKNNEYLSRKLDYKLHDTPQLSSHVSIRHASSPRGTQSVENLAVKSKSRNRSIADFEIKSTTPINSKFQTQNGYKRNKTYESCDGKDDNVYKMSEEELSKALFNLDDISNSSCEESDDGEVHCNDFSFTEPRRNLNMSIGCSDDSNKIGQNSGNSNARTNVEKNLATRCMKSNGNSVHGTTASRYHSSNTKFESKVPNTKNSAAHIRNCKIINRVSPNEVNYAVSRKNQHCGMSNSNNSEQKNCHSSNLNSNVLMDRGMSNIDYESESDYEDYDSDEYKELMDEMLLVHNSKQENSKIEDSTNSHLKITNLGTNLAQTDISKCARIDKNVSLNRISADLDKPKTMVKEVRNDSLESNDKLNDRLETCPNVKDRQSSLNQLSNLKCGKITLARGLQKAENVLKNQAMKHIPVVKKVEPPKSEPSKNNTNERWVVESKLKVAINDLNKSNGKKVSNVNIKNSRENKSDEKIFKKSEGVSINKLDVCKLLSNNKNLTISIVQPATNMGQGGTPNKNNFNLRKAPYINKFVKCSFCGELSKNLSECEKCHKSIADIGVNTVFGKSMIQLNTGGITKRQFYGAKLKGHFKQHDTSLNADKNFGESTSSNRLSVVKTAKSKRQEPVCLTLSSDEETEDHNDDSNQASNTLTNDKEDDNSMDENNEIHSPMSKSECSSGRSSPQTEQTLLSCRSIRIGSFRILNHHIVQITNNTISFPFSTCDKNNEEVNVVLHKKDMNVIKIHFGVCLPVIFIYGTKNLGSHLRSLLNMSADGPYYDPDTSDETQKRICLIPDKSSPTFQEFFIQNYNGIAEVIDKNAANEILVRSTPQAPLENIGTSVIKQSPYETRSTTISCVETPPKPMIPIFHMATYPPNPCAGRISITTEDYDCLHPEEFVNDVIIDFYLKYLFLEKLSDEDRSRTHIFSSFFYGRLTTRPQSNTSVEDHPSLTVQQKRHNRVKTWTRHIDIFSKDFIIIPVNEKSHWFLAIICFPGLVKPANMKRAISENSEDADQDEECPKQAKIFKNDNDDQMNDLGMSPVDDETGDHNDEFQNVDQKSDKKGNADLADQKLSNDERSEESLCFKEEENEQNSNIPSENSSHNHVAPTQDDSNPLPKSAFSTEDGGKRPCILIFDSLIMPRGHSSIITILREYLTEEWAAKKKNHFAFTKDNIKGANLKVPQQDNYSDCGIYVLQYVESFFRTPIENFNIPISGLEKWFPEEYVKTKREDIQTLIKRLADEQGTKYELREFVKPAPSNDSQNHVSEPSVSSSKEASETNVPTNSVSETCPTSPSASKE